MMWYCNIIDLWYLDFIDFWYARKIFLKSYYKWVPDVILFTKTENRFPFHRKQMHRRVDWILILWNLNIYLRTDLFLFHFYAAKYILPCSRSDPQINQCVKKSFNHLKPFLGKGLPEINVPALEPLIVEQMNMDNDAGAVRIKARFSEISAKGASNYTIREVRSDVKVQILIAHFYGNLFSSSFSHF